MKVRATDGISILNVPTKDEYELSIQLAVQHARWMRRQGKKATYGQNIYGTSTHIPQWTSKRLSKRTSKAYKVGAAVRKALPAWASK